MPNAGGADSVGPNAGQQWRLNGAQNLTVLFTKNREVADSDVFTAAYARSMGAKQ